MQNGFVCGVFDMFHLGHVLMLEECKSNCDYLIVALNKAENIDTRINPNKMPPLFTINERVKILQSCRFVDEVIVYQTEEELYQLLEKLNLSIRFLGEDYIGREITGKELDIQIHYCDRGHGLSTSLYKKKMYGIMQKRVD